MIATRAETPRISVVMTVYNGERYISDAIESIQQQSLRDFELIVVNDGSTDQTTGILAALDDPRVHVIQRPHVGRVPALNEALSRCRAPYVANLDADDVALPGRLEWTTEFLDAHPDTVAIGSGWEPYVQSPSRAPRRLPRSDRAIRWSFLLRNPMFNSSVTYRTDALRAIGGFSMAYADRLHDADAVLRIASHGRLRNLDQALSARRLHELQHFARVDAGRRAALHAQMRWRAASLLGFPPYLRPLAYTVATVAATRSLFVIGVLGRNGRVDRRRAVRPAPAEAR
ncbi:MAG: glycosyltransferase family 2 protein [Actinomycetes bacterium]